MIATLYNDDCLNIMKNFSDNSIDMILCDLPYGITQNKWDCEIPLDELWKQYRRIIKDNGAIVLTGQQPFTSKLILYAGDLFRYELIWEKTKAGGFLNAKIAPLRAHENIIICYKHLPCYNPQMEKGTPYTKKNVSNGDGKNYGKFERSGETLVNDGERYPRSVIKISNDNHNSLHPTQKPVALLGYLVKTYTNENMIVLDNCMGSGTTGIACINTNRNFIGIEKDEIYFNIAKHKINELIEEKMEK